MPTSQRLSYLICATSAVYSIDSELQIPERTTSVTHFSYSSALATAPLHEDGFGLLLRNIDPTPYAYTHVSAATTH